MPRSNVMVIGAAGCPMSVKGGVCSQMLALFSGSSHEDFLRRSYLRRENQGEMMVKLVGSLLLSRCCL